MDRKKRAEQYWDSPFRNGLNAAAASVGGAGSEAAIPTIAEVGAFAPIPATGTSHGVEVLWNPVNRRVKTREGEAPAEPPNAGPRCKRLPAILRSSGDCRGPRGRDAAQQELRPGMTKRCDFGRIGMFSVLPAS